MDLPRAGMVHGADPDGKVTDERGQGRGYQIGDEEDIEPAKSNRVKLGLDWWKQQKGSAQGSRQGNDRPDPQALTPPSRIVTRHDLAGHDRRQGAEDTIN